MGVKLVVVGYEVGGGVGKLRLVNSLSPGVLTSVVEVGWVVVLMVVVVLVEVVA